LFTGVTTLSVDKACIVTYGLHINGVLAPPAQTPITFVNPSKKGNMSITGFPTINKGDYFEIFAKSDTAGTVITHDALSLTFLGDRF